jgi:hypothetical protein
MNAAERSLQAFGIYLLGLGSLLIVMPSLVLSPVGLAVPQDVWLRVAGMLVLFLGVYYCVAARSGATALVRASVPVRASVVLFFAAFVGVGLAPPVLLLFGAVDLAAAAWTWSALRAAHKGAAVSPA